MSLHLNAELQCLWWRCIFYIWQYSYTCNMIMLPCYLVRTVAHLWNWLGSNIWFLGVAWTYFERIITHHPIEIEQPIMNTVFRCLKYADNCIVYFTVICYNVDMCRLTAIWTGWGVTDNMQEVTCYYIWACLKFFPDWWKTDQTSELSNL